MGIKDFLDRLRRKKDKYKEFEEDMNIQEKYYEKKKSANERELERYQNEAREKVIKAELDKWRKNHKHEVEFGHQILAVPNVYKNEKQIILKQQNLFSHRKNIHKHKRLFMS